LQQGNNNFSGWKHSYLCIFGNVSHYFLAPEACFLYADKNPHVLSSLPSSASTSSFTDARGVLMSLQPVVASLVGRSIEDAGLRGQPDAFLVAIDRGTETLHAVAPTEVLQANDILWFAGTADGVILLRKIPGVVTGSLFLSVDSSSNGTEVNVAELQG
jgi:hypothetical protein